MASHARLLVEGRGSGHDLWISLSSASPVEPHRLPAERSVATAGGQAPTFRVRGLAAWPARPARPRAATGSAPSYPAARGRRAMAAAPSAPASSASAAPDGLSANEVPEVERKGPRGGRSRGASGVARTPGPTWVGHPAGAALESAPERAVAARRFRFRVAARPAAVARRPMGAAPSAPKPVREAWSRGADVAGAPWQTRRPPPARCGKRGQQVRRWLEAVADAPSAPKPGAVASAPRSCSRLPR